MMMIMKDDDELIMMTTIMIRITMAITMQGTMLMSREKLQQPNMEKKEPDLHFVRSFLGIGGS